MIESCGDSQVTEAANKKNLKSVFFPGDGAVQ